MKLGAATRFPDSARQGYGLVADTSALRRELSELKLYQQGMPFAATRSSIRAVRRRLCI